MVGIRDKYIVASQESKNGLQIVLGDEVMEIPYSEVKSRIKAKSDRQFFDRYSHKKHYLYYFDWKPREKPATLF